MNTQKLMLGLFKQLPRPIMRLMSGKPMQVDGFTLDPHIQFLGKQEGPDLTKLPIKEARATADAMMSMLNAKRSRGVDVSDEMLPGSADNMPVRHYFPNNLPRPAPLILFFHQGGMVLLGLDACDTFCTILAQRCKAHVISLDYRLAPDHVFPAAIDDARALWDYVIADAETLGVDTSQIGLCGDSAGGLMTAVLCQILRDEKSAIRPKAQMLIYPWVTTQPQTGGSMESCAEGTILTRTVMEWFEGLVFPDPKQRDHPWANPLQNDLQDLPPAIVATAGFDPLRDQGKAYADGLQKAGNQAQYLCFGNLSHSFLSFGQLSKQAVRASEQLAKEFASLLHA